MFNKLIDLFVEWGIRGYQWPLLLVLAIPALFLFTQNYFDLPFQHTFLHWLFWLGTGLIFMISGALFLAVLLFSLGKLHQFWVSGFLLVWGIWLMLAGHDSLRTEKSFDYVETNHKKIMALLKKWIPDMIVDNHEAQALVGEFYEEGIEGERRYDIAAKLYEKAAQQGNGRAAFNLAQMYNEGRGVKKDRVKSALLALKANDIDDLNVLLQTSGRSNILITGIDDNTLRKLKESGQLPESVAQRLTITPPKIQLIDPPISIASGDTQAAPEVLVETGVDHKAVVGRVVSNAGIMSLLINNQEEKIDNNGLFRANVLLQPGTTQITIVAIDRQGRQSSLVFLVKQAPTAEMRKPIKIGPLPPIDFGKYYALVIGNNDYTRLPKLETAVNDTTWKVSSFAGRQSLRLSGWH